MSKTRANFGRRRTNNEEPKINYSGFNIDGNSKKEKEVSLRLKTLEKQNSLWNGKGICPAANTNLNCPADKKSAKKKQVKIHPDKNPDCIELSEWMSREYARTCYGDKSLYPETRWDSKDSDQVKREAEELAEINRLQEQLRQNMEDEFGVSSKVPSHCTPKKQKKANGVAAKYCNNPNNTDKLCECTIGSPANKKAMKKQSPKPEMLALKDGSVGPNPRDLAGLSGSTNQSVDMGHCQSAVDPTSGHTYYYHGEKTTWDPSDPMCHKQLTLQDSAPSKPTRSLRSATQKIIAKERAKKEADRSGEAMLALLAKTREEQGHAMVENVTKYNNKWEQGTVAADATSWAGEKYAHNTSTGEYIIWSQKVTQDDCGNKGVCANPSANAAESCSRCIWVLYPSVKYGTESDASGKHFANVPGRFWYYNKNEKKWHTQKPEGIEFDQNEINTITRNLYGEGSHAMDSLKRNENSPDTVAPSKIETTDETKKLSEDVIRFNKTITDNSNITDGSETDRFKIFEKFVNPSINHIKELDTNNVIDYYLEMIKA